MNHPPPQSLPVPQAIPAYSAQQNASWKAGDASERPLLDCVPNGLLWRVQVIGDVVVKVRWGTSTQRELVLDAPLVADLPGNVTISATPRDSSKANEASVTLTKVSSAGPQALRKYVEGPGLALPNDACEFVALAASTVTIHGTGVALAIGQRIPLVAGSVLTLGKGVIEWTV